MRSSSTWILIHIGSAIVSSSALYFAFIAFAGKPQTAICYLLGATAGLGSFFTVNYFRQRRGQ